MHIAIRADASASLGTGHLRRCLVLAHALADGGAQVTFVCHPMDGVAAALLRGQPFACLWLPADAQPTCLDATVALLQACAPHWLVVDHYALDADWHEGMRDRLHCRILVIDDLADRRLAPDLLVDPNFHEDPAQKYHAVLQPGTKMLAGPRFALLAPAYALSERYAFNERVRSIGIFMGGSDPGGTCSVALQACRTVAGFAGPIEIVSSVLSPHYESLRQDCLAWPGTTLLADLPDLAAFFARHDMQIGAGGGATWERCYAGAPTVACVIAPNQMATLPALHARGVLLWAQSSGDLQQSIGAAVLALLQDPVLRQDLSQRSRTLVDGRGAARVAAVMLGTTLRAPTVRRATQADEALLLDWANDPMVRTHAFRSAEIQPRDHAAWLRARLAEPAQCRMYIVESANGIPLGQVRFDHCDAGWEISYSLDSVFRQTGLARSLLQAALATLHQAVGETHAIGRVKHANVASSRVFLGLGFTPQEAQDARGPHLLYTLTLR